jgi:hypothetical protein
MNKYKLRHLPIVVLSIVCVQLAVAWGLARFVHYHDQRQILPSAHYTADVLPASAGAPEQDATEFRLSADGQSYVRVATLGTAHHMARTSSDLLPILFFTLMGLIATIWVQAKQPAGPDSQPPAPTP